VKIAELVLYVAVAVVLGLALCALYLPGLAVAKLVRVATDRTKRPAPPPPLHMRRW
jgi:hypothetical protein